MYTALLARALRAFALWYHAPTRPTLLLVESMHSRCRAPRAASLTALALALAGCAGSPPTAESLAGDWQFIRTSAWIRIAPDGRTFQCRQGRSGTLFRSLGHLQGATITWQQEWEPDTVALRGGWLVLTGPHGSFSFGKPLDPLPVLCEAPF